MDRLLDTAIFGLLVSIAALVFGAVMAWDWLYRLGGMATTLWLLTAALAGAISKGER